MTGTPRFVGLRGSVSTEHTDDRSSALSDTADSQVLDGQLLQSKKDGDQYSVEILGGQY